MELEKAMIFRDRIIGKLLAEKAHDLSNAEFERILRPCVAGNLCVVAARRLRDSGRLVSRDIASPVCQDHPQSQYPNGYED